MDKRTEQAAETEREQALLTNTKIETHAILGAVRFQRPTPNQERQIAEERRKQYQSDLMNDAVLSKDQIEAKAIQRGMWTPELTDKIASLVSRVGEAMGLLDMIGFQSFEELLAEYNKNGKDLLALYPETGEGSEIRAVVRSYCDLDSPPTAEMRKEIADAATSSSVDDLLDLADKLRTQLDLLGELGTVRKELKDLTDRQSRMFADSIESRADRAEQMALLHFCTSNAETGKPLYKSLADLWNAPAEIIEWLVLEMHYFTQGIDEKFKATLGKYGFIKRLSDTRNSSEDSPVQPPSNSDGESVEKTPSASSEATESAT